MNKGSDRLMIVRKPVGLKEVPHICLSENMFHAMSKLPVDSPANEVSAMIDQNIFNYEHSSQPTVPPPKQSSSNIPRSLPVHQYRSAILSTIASSQVVVICGETGMLAHILF